MVLRVRISSSRLPLGLTTITVSPTFLLSRQRPMGEVVEIFPVATSDSSLVTSLYCISSFLVLSKKCNTSWSPAKNPTSRTQADPVVGDVIHVDHGQIGE